MKQQFRKITTISLLLLATSALSAQNNRHEIVLYAGGGLSSLKYNATIGKQRDGLGGQIGLGYNFFFIPNLGIKTGVEFSLHNASFTLDHFDFQHDATDIENSPFEFRCTLNNYKERQSLVMLQIPLMLQFQIGDKHQFYAAAGGKVGFPLSAKYNSSKIAIYNSGYYEEEDCEYTTQLFMGFGQFSGSSGNLKFKTAFFASAEIGVKWMMKGEYSFYTGLYMDYGLNNIVKPRSEPLQFLEYNTDHPSDFTVNSIIESKYLQNTELELFTNKIIPITAGIKLILAF